MPAKKRGLREKDIQNAILEWLKWQPRAFCWQNGTKGSWNPTTQRFHSLPKHCKRGAADILGMWDERFLAIEVKMPGKHPTEFQHIFLDEINRRGGIAFVARSVDDVSRRLLT